MSVPGRIYTSTFTGVAVSAAQDIMSIVAPSDMVIQILEFHLAQDTDVGDAGELIEVIRMRSGQTTVGSAGTTPAMVPLVFSDTPATSTVRANDTIQATGGTIVPHYHWGWNVRVPFQQIWTPETTPLLSPSRRATFELFAAPGSSITCSGTLIFKEIGG